MPRVEQSIDVEQPPEAVFEYVAVPENYPTIIPSIVALESAGDPLAEGASGEGVVAFFGGQLQFSFESVRFERPEEHVVSLEGGVDGTLEYEFKSIAPGTELTLSLDVDPPEALQGGMLTETVAHEYLRGEVHAALHTLKRIVEDENTE